VSYRHLMVWRDGMEKMETTPPHDITDQKVASHMPKGEGAERLLSLMEASRPILAAHPVNNKRQQMAAGRRRRSGSGGRVERQRCRPSPSVSASMAA
jgi:2,3-bisphosphoglycerate-independent phosphoglycerate mutase